MQTRTYTALAGLPALVLLGFAQGCTTNEGDTYNNYGGAGPAGPPGAPGAPGQEGKDGQDGKDGTDGDGATNGTGGTGDLPDEYPAHRPDCDVVPFADLEIDLWGADGHLFYFEVTPEMRVADDNRFCDYGGGYGQPVYVLGGGGVDPCPPAATNVRVVPAGGTECADTGLVELDLPGQSSWKPWSDIPNFKLDVGEFQDQEFSTADKTVRMNNGQADSTIVREATALAIWRAMDYPAPRTRFVQTQSNVWDYDFEVGVFAAHNMVQPYKRAFFEDFLADFDANLPRVTSAWEGNGNPFDGYLSMECEWSEDNDCQDIALMEIISTVQNAPSGEGFMAATEDVIDWPMIHQNQCLAAITSTGDDWIHNSNNVVIALREDGKIMYLPYSTDISGGHPWYSDTPYDSQGCYGYYCQGGNLADRCKQDPDCRTLALDTCDAMLNQFEALDVVETIVKERCDALADAGLERPADGDVCDSLEDFYGGRAAELREELTWLREQDSGYGGEGGAYGGTGATGGSGGFPGAGGAIMGPI
jgi:hypothetical protein